MTLMGFVRFGLRNFPMMIKANSYKRRNGSRKRMIEQNIFEFAFTMFFHACQMDQRRIVVNSMNRRRLENKNSWRIGHDPSMENWKGLTVADYTKRRNKENNLTFAGSCGRDFNACLFWIDWTCRAELLLNKKIFMKILYCFLVSFCWGWLFHYWYIAITNPIKDNSICAWFIVCTVAIVEFVAFIIKQIKK